MLRITTPFLLLSALAGLSQSAWAERYPDTPRPIDWFINGEEILEVKTLRDTIHAQGNLPLGRALLTVGRVDLLGLNRSLYSFDASTLEVPLGGEFEVREEQVSGFVSARAQRGMRGLDSLGHEAGF